MKKLVALTVCFIFIGVVGIFAEPSRHTWEVGPEVSYIRYEEPGVMEEKGMMYGLVASYTYRDTIISKIEGRFSMGWVDYTGETWGGTPIRIDDIPDYLLEFRWLIGPDFSGAIFSFIPYVGFGYRYLNDNPQEKYLGGYKREANYFYSPLGIEAIAELENGWLFGVVFEYDCFWSGLQKSYFSDIGSIDIENDQKDGYGLRGSIKIQKSTAHIDIALEPFVRYWDIEDSEVSYGCYEPKNNSIEYGAEATIRF